EEEIRRALQRRGLLEQPDELDLLGAPREREVRAIVEPGRQRVERSPGLRVQDAHRWTVTLDERHERVAMHVAEPIGELSHVLQEGAPARRDKLLDPSPGNRR